MEIPSSSPIYSPLKPDTDTGSYNLNENDQVDLFPSKHTEVPETQETNDIEPESSFEEEEITIFSDSEVEVPDTDTSDVEANEKSTQNYLDALLTDSVLESLPLPSSQRDLMRKKFEKRIN